MVLVERRKVNDRTHRRRAHVLVVTRRGVAGGGDGGKRGCLRVEQTDILLAEGRKVRDRSFTHHTAVLLAARFAVAGGGSGREGARGA
eukprot:6804032-Prymnesium_polylepis.1